MQKRKVLVVFLGSFNPPINSHFMLAQQLLDKNKEVEKILFVPVNKKYNKPDLIDDNHRYNMLKLVCDKNENFDVSKIEIQNDRYLYTIETLIALKTQYENYDICFSIGTDNLKTLSTWKEAEKLVSDYKIIVLERGDEDNMEDIIKNDVFLKQHKEAFMKLDNAIYTNLSSTYVREKIKNGESVKYLMPDKVYQYIRENKLYGY